MKKLVVGFSILLVSGCSWFKSSDFGMTYAEQRAGYSYVPLEPSSVELLCTDDSAEYAYCDSVSKKLLLSSLSDNSIRIATRNLSTKSNFGVAAIGADIGVEGNSYEVIIDFANTQTANKRFLGKWRVSVPDFVVPRGKRCYPFERRVLGSSPSDKYEIWSLIANIWKENNDFVAAKREYDTYLRNREEYSEELDLICGKKSKYYRKDEFKKIKVSEIETSPEEFNVPVYIGIGLRLKANVTVLKGSVNLTSLPSLTAAVESGDATGTMSVQTIGISGKAARTNLLLLDKIDETTIQNAIQVLANIKASIESEDTVVTPRILGFHNTVAAGPQGINLIHSKISGDDYRMQLYLDETAYADGELE